MTRPRARIRHWLVLFILAIMVAAPMNFVVGLWQQYCEPRWWERARPPQRGIRYIIVHPILRRSDQWTKEYGWPLSSTCIVSRRNDRAGILGGIERGLTVWEDPSQSISPDSVVIPLLPVFPGFLINTVLYAAVLLACFPGIGRVRQSLRRRANRCLHCAYSLAGLPPNSPCPECGKEL